MTQTPPVSTPPAAKKPQGNPVGRFLLTAMLIMLIPPAIIATAIFMPGPLTDQKTVVIPRGSHVNNIAALLDQSGAIFGPNLFRIAARLVANDVLKAGEYQFPAHQSMANAVMMMRDGKSVVRLFTVAEGLSSIEIAHLLENNPALSGEIPPVPPEGSLLPETYRYSYGDNRASLIARMQKAMQDTLADAWAKRDMSLPLKSPEQAVVMASIIEKETGKPEERPRIARVFYNRLTHSMRLQSDPTVIYALNKGDGPLDHDLDHNDLATNSPYNTYASDGLPPGPICNPGRASINAALHPEQNEFIYFVADGTGGHVFAKDLGEHNINVAKLRERRAAENQ